MNSKSGTQAVPKFGSFKPKTVANNERTRPEQPSDKTSEEHDRHDSHKRHGHKRGTQARHRHDRPSSDEERSEYRQRAHRKSDKALATRLQPDDDAEPVIASWDEDPTLYVVDRKGDLQNVRYGHIHRYDVPAYRREGAGGVLGLASNKKIDRFLSDDRELAIRDTRKIDLKVPEKLLSKTTTELDSQRYRMVSATQRDEGLNHGADFISLSSSSKRKRKSQSPSPSSEGDVTADYRSMVGRTRPSTGRADSDMELASSSEEEEKVTVDGERELQIHNTRLSRLVKEEPNNVNAWLNLISHQDKIASRNRVIQALKTSEKLSLSKVKISIFEDALKTVSKDVPERAHLLLGVVDEGYNIWDSDVAAGKLQNLLKKNPNSIHLHLCYVDFCQTTSNFRYDDCSTAFLRCLEALSSIKTASNQKPLADKDGLQQARIYVFLRFTCFLRESGFLERAFALWQAAIEFYFFRPDIHDAAVGHATPMSYLLERFEEFWDEEVPRFGEIGAKGWRSFYKDGAEAAQSTTVDVDLSVNPANGFLEFGEKEISAMDKLCLPGRTGDDIGTDDPFHTILSSDITKVLEIMPDYVDSGILLDAWLCFSRMPPLSGFGQPQSRFNWWLDPFLYNNMDIFTAAPFEGDPPLLDSGKVSFEQLQAATFFHKPAFAKASSRSADWLRRELKFLVETMPQHSALAEYYLKFEYRYDPDNARRIARSLLKNRSSDERLWNVFAIGEYSLGRIAEADAIARATISTNTSGSQQLRGDSIMLGCTWIWEALRRHELSNALHRAAEIGGHPDNLLEAWQSLNTLHMSCLSDGQHERFAAFTECLALFRYLSEGNLEAALEVFVSTQELLGHWDLASTTTAEVIHQAKAQLVNFHISNTFPTNKDQGFSTAFRSDVVRRHLRESLARFPNNTVILNAHMLNESRFPIVDRDTALSDFFPYLSLKSDAARTRAQGNPEDPSLVRFLHAIQHQLQRLKSHAYERSAVTYRTRSLFQRAVASKSCKHSVAFWTLYLEFEISAAETSSNADIDTVSIQTKRLKRAKDVYFQGTRMLPWHKGFAMMAFTKLENAMDEKELQGVWETMVERELRLYVDMEPVLEEISRMQRSKDNQRED
ncbi:MAG: hypothetical protein M1820_005091 [Bogoriella megaspora]|nr:MAG: hypothetical protein M1820_005091 [Bogoriella megaspora]